MGNASDRSQACLIGILADSAYVHGLGNIQTTIGLGLTDVMSIEGGEVQRNAPAL